MITRRRSNLSYVIAFLAVLFILGGTGYYLYSEQQYQEALKKPMSSSATERMAFSVKKGESAREIGTNLFEKKIIVSDSAFTRYVKEKNVADQLKSGLFVLKPSETIPELVEVLVGKRVEELSITIPEGYTVKDISDVLKEKNLVQGNAFVDCTEKCEFPSPLLRDRKENSLEGFLFPSTYFIDPSTFTPESFINRLISTFEKKIAPYEKDIPDGKLYDILIMASMIEKETRTEEERPIVSGILWKRLENHWYLGVDATLRYYKDDWVNEITYADLEDRNPYNTRKTLGLPPTPIANPGESSLKAAIYPKESEYWYYLHDKDGNIHYAKTLEEHEQNKVKYLY